MVRLFERPELGKKEKESYLKTLEMKILQKEQEWEATQERMAENQKAIDKTFQNRAASLTKELNDIENALVFKREERAELEKPLIERMRAIDARESKVIQGELDIKTQQQAIFEKERATEAKLDGIKDLSDELAEIRVRLNIKEKQHDTKAQSLANKEMEYLIAYQNFREEAAKIRDTFKEREYAISLRELNVQSEKENLLKREQLLENGHIWLNDQREVLGRAWAELRSKK